MKYNMKQPMSQVIMKNTNRRASLRGMKPAHTVLMRMAVDEARAERIRDLRVEHNLKWREIAAYCGVTGAISQANAQKLTELFRAHGAQVEDDYVWRGTRPTTPDLMTKLNGLTQLDRVEAKLDLLLKHLHVEPDTIADAISDFETETADATGRRDAPGRRRPGPLAA